MKKNIFAAITMMSAASCLLCACTTTDTGQTIELKNEQSISNNVSTEQQTDNTGNIEKGTTPQTDNAVTDLAAGSNTGIAIDYSIDSYAAIQNFGYNLFRESLTDENPVLSPVSAYLALSMAGMGADGNTRTEFLNLLGEDMMALSDDMMNALSVNSDSLNLSLANSAWIDDEYIVDEAWLGTIRSLLDAEAFQTDISSSDAMDNMNSWIKDATNGLIEKMIEEPLHQDARLALFNTIYFKANWISPFEKEDTCTEAFTLADGQTIAVDMMNKYHAHFAYLSNDIAEGIVLPYYGYNDKSGELDANLAFVALKPKGEAAVREMCDKLTDEVVKDLLVNRQTTWVNIKLPKFEIAFEQELNERLQNMGLIEAFDEDYANFDRMGQTKSGNNLYISLVCQKAKVIVDEEGTEAAAVTEVAMDSTASELIAEPINVYFDEPFFYMIMDMDKEIPLFIGIIDNPAA